MSIYRGSGGTGTADDVAALNQIADFNNEAEGYKDAAASSATAAASSASAAASSESSVATDAATASTAASNASTSATNAAASETAAAASETAAGTSETNAASSATAAASSATSASGSATTATTQASAASTSATNAATSATAAASSASAASTSATNAATSASNASTSASAAATSASNASASADAALAALDNFDDRYLGQKTSDPTTDNDGDALVAGALYFNTTDDAMKVYEGSTWVAAYASLSGALLSANNLSDLDNVATARTNLGLGTAATTASTDYATAAQGALADSALQSYTETDPVVGAVSGIVKANGAGTISAAVAGTDYLTPTGDGSGLTGIDALPSQTGNNGKYLTTDGSTASWDTIVTTFPFYKADGSSDTITITSGQFPFYKADGSQDNIGVS